MSADPAVSIIIPTRNRLGILRRTLASVRAQADVPIEVVVVDEGSDDGTPAFLRDVAGERLRVIRHDEPRGVCAARNAGVAAARSRWVAFLDDDDLWAPDKLRSQLDALQSTDGARWCATAAIVVDERLRTLRPQPPLDQATAIERLLGDNQVPGGGSGVLAERDLVLAAGGFDERLSYLGDWDLWIRLALAAPVAVVPRPLVAYVQHDGGMSRQVDALLSDLEVVERKYEEERRQRSVAWKGDYWLRYRFETSVRSHTRSHARDAAIEVMRVYRHWSWLLPMAGALAAPRLIDLRDRVERRRTPAAWHAEFDGWMGPFRLARSVAT